MEELVKGVFNAPVGTIFVLAGVLFLFIAVIGKISGKIEPGLKARVLAGVLGSAFISIGLAMNWPSLQQQGTVFTPPPIKEEPTTDGKPPPPPPHHHPLVTIFQTGCRCIRRKLRTSQSKCARGEDNMEDSFL